MKYVKFWPKIKITLIQFKWQLIFQYFKHISPYFANCMFIFHKAEVQTVILRCLIGLDLEFWKYDSWFPSGMSKLTSVWNKLNMSLKHWYIEARLVFCTCYGPKKLSKCLLGTIQTAFSENSNYYRGKYWWKSIFVIPENALFQG